MSSKLKPQFNAHYPIFPKTGSDERYQRLLELRIPKFSIERPIHTSSIRDKLLSHPAIIDFLADNKLFSTQSIAPGLLSSEFLEPDRLLDLEFIAEDLSFRQLLNKITVIKRGG